MHARPSPDATPSARSPHRLIGLVIDTETPRALQALRVLAVFRQVDRHKLFLLLEESYEASDNLTRDRMAMI